MNNIVLCGFMGCGKSSVGKLLAKRLESEFIDTDTLCEEREGMSIPAMFEKWGEAGFRDAEHSACAQAAKLSDKVIATGGGALTFDRNAELFKEDTVIYLSVSFDEIDRRIGGNDGRPLFKDRQKAMALYQSRIGAYEAAADMTVDASGSPKDVAQRIINLIGGRGK